MPELGAYVGQLLSEITVAKMQADLESVRIAELYASHPLLRNMPVPHFRMPTIEADVPVVIKQVSDQPPGELPRGAPPLEEMRTAFDKVLETQLKAEGIRLDTKQKGELRAILDKTVLSLAQPAEVAIDVKRVADELSVTAAGSLAREGGPIDPARRLKLEEALQAAARVNLIALRKPPVRMQVLATTAEVREAGPSEVITRFHLKITEDAFEWTTIESESGKQDRLVVE